jgi:hypothetical protein
VKKLFLATMDNVDPLHRLHFSLSTNYRLGAEQVALGVAVQDLPGERRALLFAGDEQRCSRVRPPVQLALARAWSEQKRMARCRSAGFTKASATRARNSAIIANGTGALQHHVGR